MGNEKLEDSAIVITEGNLDVHYSSFENIRITRNGGVI